MKPIRFLPLIAATVVCMTGYSAEHARLEGRVDAIIDKPFSAETLLRAVARALPPAGVQLGPLSATITACAERVEPDSGPVA